MRKKKENFLGQIKSKQPIMGTLVITLMLLATAIFFVGFVPEKVKAASTDYIYYKAITIESDYIGSTLTNFPILVHDNTGNLSGNVLANGSDIAFYAVGNSTQYNHEVEYYNSTTGELWAWVNVTSIASGTDTLFYMYYDDSDGGYPIGHNPTSTWNGNYIFVSHMNDNTTSSVDDSTSNHNEGTKNATNQPIETTSGKIGNAQDFEETDKSLITLDTDIAPLTAFTLEAWLKPESAGSVTGYSIISSAENEAGSYGDTAMLLSKLTIPPYYGNCLAQKSDSNIFSLSGNTYPVKNNSWAYICGTWTGTNGYIYYNTSLDNTVAGSGTMNSGANFKTIIGAGRLAANSYRSYVDGIIDEIRISKTARSSDWLNTSFHSGNQTTGFLTLGIQDGTDLSSYQIIGLSNGIITWGGVSDTTVYCNSSGDANEWLEVNMSINATDNVTEIRVFVDDLNDTAAYINASNITLYVTNASNTTYYSFGTFLDGGSNITINQSTWNTYAYALSNPFNVTGLRNTNTSIFLIFKLTIPAALQTDVFWSTSSTVLKIYIGYLT